MNVIIDFANLISGIYTNFHTFMQKVWRSILRH